jgi:hypothetical protein
MRAPVVTVFANFVGTVNSKSTTGSFWTGVKH